MRANVTSPFSVGAALAIHRDELVSFAERRVGSRALAEDLVQQAAVKAIANADRLRDPASVRAWLFQITRRLIADNVGSRSEVALASDPASTQELAGFGCACVLANLQQLKPEFAEVLRRVVIEAVPIIEVAPELGLSANAATVRLSRARAALRAQLHAHCGTGSVRECLDCACEERGCCGGTESERRPERL